MSESVAILHSNLSVHPLHLWQREYGLPVGSTQIGQYFAYTEPRFQQDIKDFGRLVVCAPLMRLLDRWRGLVGQPMVVNSFNRTTAYQAHLRQRGLRTARTSPHVAKMAADIDTRSHGQTVNWVEQLHRASEMTGIPCRIGYMDYLQRGYTFIHVDVCPVYYAPGAPMHHQRHPNVWEQPRTW